MASLVFQEIPSGGDLKRQGVGGDGMRQVRDKKKPHHSHVYKAGSGEQILLEGSGEPSSNDFKLGK